MTEPIDPPEGDVEGPIEPVPGGQPEGEPQPWMPMPGTYGSRNAGRRQSILESFGQVVTRKILKEELEDADSLFQQALADGRALVAEAQQHVDDALGAVANAGSIMDTIQGTGADVVAKHTEVLTLHGQAITAASNAADDAAMAAAKALEASDHAADALILFEAQQAQIDAEQNARLDLHEQVIDAIREAQLGGMVERTYIKTAHLDGAASDSRVSIHSGADNLTVTALGSWAGRMVVTGGWNVSGNGSGERIGEYDIPQPGGGRAVTLSKPPSTGGRVWARVDYAVSPGVQQTRDLTGGAVELSDGVWATIPTHTWTVPADATRISIYFKAWWGEATYWGSHGLRILVNGSVVATWGPKSGIGPLIGAGARYGAVDLNNANLPVGAAVTFQAYGQHDYGWGRNIRDTETRISWIAGA